jgi:TolB-like protein
MRSILRVVAVWALFPALPVGAEAPVGKKVRVAVMEMRPLGTEAVKAELLSEVALTEASRVAGLEVIGRSDIAAMVGFEKQKQMLGCADDAGCLAEIGGALGVDYVLLGSLGRLGNLYRVDLKLVDARKARVLARTGDSVTGEEEKLVATVQKAVRELVGPLAERPPAAASAATLAQGPATVSTTARPAPRTSPGAGAREASPLDGRWAVRLECSAFEGAKGYVQSFDGAIVRGVFQAGHGKPDAAASLRLRGPLRPDGSATLVATGRAGAREYATSPPGTPYTYHVQARFSEREGTGTRTDRRPCTFTFTRR